MSRPHPIICLFGPTAVGKTRLLADFFSPFAEVVSVDSIQIYRGLDIGSAKPTPAEQAAIPHHLLDILTPDQGFNVGDFCRLAEAACADILSRGKIPVLSGGTAYYFKHFLLGMPSAPESTPEVRDKTEALFADLGPEAFRTRLKEVDPASWERIMPNDHYRLKRAWEVYERSGRPLSSFALPKSVRQDFRVLCLGLVRDRDDLVARIEGRIDAMLEAGLLGEIRGLLAAGYTAESPGLKGIGYAEFLPWLTAGEGSLAACIEQVRIHSRQYAKRQMTFFKHLPDVHWHNPEDLASLLPQIREFLEASA